MSKRILVTGGAGFIGSAVVRHIIRETGHRVLVVDKLTYAGNLDSLAPSRAIRATRSCVRTSPMRRKCARCSRRFQPDAVMHLAAESHVDRSIDGPGDFIRPMWSAPSPCCRRRWVIGALLPGARKEAFRFHHISTDEVFGSLGDEGMFCEDDRLRSALALLGLQGRVRSSGPRLASHLWAAGGRHQLLEQLWAVPFPEKLIPLIIINALEGLPLPVYGKARTSATGCMSKIMRARCWRRRCNGTVGQTYCIGGNCERTNIDVVEAICALMDELAPNAEIGPRKR